MSRVSVKHAKNTCQELFLEQRYGDATKVLEMAARDVQESRDWDVLRQIHERIPTEVLLASSALTCGYAKTLVGSSRIKELLDFTATALSEHTDEKVVARLKLERAWAFLAECQWQDVCELLDQALPDLHGAERGIAYRRYGFSAFKMGRPWEDHFRKAKELLNGRALGLTLIDEGLCLDLIGRTREARPIWLQALQPLQNDHFHVAWIHYSIGITALRDDDPNAEQHLWIADELTRSDRAAGFRPDVLIGLCTARRLRGEWARAEASARAALRIAKEPTTFQQAYFDLARTLRLCGRKFEALEQYQNALQVLPNASEAHVSLAACYLALGDVTRSRQSLGRVTVVTGFSVWLQAIVRAELARLAGDQPGMLECLAGVSLTMLYVREEVDAWPELFAAVKSAGHAVPIALERISRTVVRVEALGILRVQINQQSVALLPTSRPAELLVYLLEHGGQASLERLRDAFSPNAITDLERRRARKALWNTVERLRDLLGWPESILAVGSAYRLDPNVTWQYDVEELRQSKSVTTRLFLDGLYSDWVLEVRNSLE